MASDVRSAPLTRRFYLPFILAAAVNLAANLIADAKDLPHPDGKWTDWEWVRWLLLLSKPMLAPALAGLLFLSTQGAHGSIHRRSFYVALFFCWLGDLALLVTLWPKQDFFFFMGLGAFGVGHIFFIRSYLPANHRELLLRSKTFYGLPFLVYGYTLYSIIYHQLVETKQMTVALAIAVYMIVLLSNGMSGFLRLQGSGNRASAASILVGIVLFVQSDTIIAITQYVNTLPLERFAIMATYILGLFLMVRGCILDIQQGTQQQQPARLATAA